MRKHFAKLLLAGVLIVLAQSGVAALFLRAPASYQGPCDVKSCAEALSLTHALTDAYHGPLFQLLNFQQGTTLNIGQTAQRTADLSGVPAFCAGNTCMFEKIYGQINGNNVPEASTSISGPSICNFLGACAPLYFIDPPSGLPIMRTAFPAQMYSGNGSSTGITGGTGPVTVVQYGRNEGWSTCCGFFGIAHQWNICCTLGTDFLTMFGYGQPGGSPFMPCATASTNCTGIDEEVTIPVTDQADYSPTAKQDMLVMVTFSGVSTGNQVTGYANSSTPIFGPQTPMTGTSQNPGTTIRIGGGGDLTHVDGIFRDGMIFNTALSGSDYAAIQANLNTFYGARSPDACASTGDMGFYFNPAGGADNADVSVSSTVLGYALRRMSASYWGPIAILQDSVGTQHTYGPAATGCGIDPAAQTFCNANPPCRVAKLWQETTYSSQNSNQPDPLLNLSQATTGNMPTVNWTGLNSVPTMVFSGSQSLCSGTPSSNDATYQAVGVVGKRTSVALAPAVTLNSGSVGWSGSANTAISTVSTSISGTLSDNAFHSIIWEALGTAGGQTTLYGDGASIASGSSASFPDIATHTICLGTDGTHFLTGEIGEVAVVSNASPGNVNAGTATIAATLYARQHAAWGI